MSIELMMIYLDLLGSNLDDSPLRRAVTSKPMISCIMSYFLCIREVAIFILYCHESKEAMSIDKDLYIISVTI